MQPFRIGYITGFICHPPGCIGGVGRSKVVFDSVQTTLAENASIIFPQHRAVCRHKRFGGQFMKGLVGVMSAPGLLIAGEGGGG